MRPFGLLVLFLWPYNASAVTASDIQSRYTLVGVIAAEREDKKSIVVLKDKETKRSLTLSEGESLPYDRTWMVGTVYRNAVVLRNGDDQIRVTYGGTAADDQPAEYSSFVESDVPAAIKVKVEAEPPTKSVSNYDNHNNAQYIDNLVANGDLLEELDSGEEYRSDSLEEYEQHLKQELQRVRKERNAEEDGNPVPVAPDEPEADQQEPVFNDLPSGPTYFE